MFKCDWLTDRAARRLLRLVVQNPQSCSSVSLRDFLCVGVVAMIVQLLPCEHALAISYHSNPESMYTVYISRRCFVVDERAFLGMCSCAFLY